MCSTDSFEASVEQWEDDCCRELAVEHESEVFRKFVSLANALGYRYVAYGLEYPSSLAEPHFSFFCNFRDDWQEKFLNPSATNHGSKVCYGKRISAPVAGGSDYYWTRRDFLREARAAGVHLKWLEVIDGRGGTTAMVGLSRNPDDGWQVRHKTHALIQAVVEAMELRLLRKNLPQFFIELNAQERQYLRWVLDGKTSDVIATIMGIKASRIKYMQRTLPPQFDRAGIYPTAFFAYRLGLLQ